MSIPEEQHTANDAHEQGDCIRCHAKMDQDARLCKHCGAWMPGYEFEQNLKRQRRFTALTVFFGLQLLISLAIHFSHNLRGLVPLLIADGLFSLVTIVYAVIYWKNIRYLLKWPSFSLLKLLGYAVSAIVAASLVNYVIRWVNKTIFDTEYYYYYAFSQLSYPKLATLLMVALQPAIMEELAFRGVMQEGLTSVFDAKRAAIITAILFTLLHLGFITFVWMMPLAWVLSRIRMKEQTLWYGVIIHFCFNATACFQEFFELNLF